MTYTLKLDWDDDTISAVRLACSAAAEVCESMGSLPGAWNLNDAVRLRTAAQDIREYVSTREQIKQGHIIARLRQALSRTTATERDTP